MISQLSTYTNSIFFSPANDIPQIPAWVELIETIRNLIFTATFILNRIKDLPLGQFSNIFAGIAMLGFALANSLQLISSRYYHKNGDTTFGNISTLSAVVGIIASVGILIQPQAWLIWIWLFVLNNLLWYCAEYYRCRDYHPNTYPRLKNEANSYLSHVQWFLIASISSSICYTLSACLVQYASPLFILGLSINYLATFIAFMQLKPNTDSNVVILQSNS